MKKTSHTNHEPDNLNKLDDLTINLAKQENINLTAKHLIIINLLNTFQQEFNISPSTRALINYAQNKNPDLQLSSILFIELFPGGIAQAYRIAGLPKSPRCL